MPTPPPVTNPPPEVTVNGAVVTPGTSYTVADVQALPVSSQKDTFLQGTSPRTFTFTGTPLFTLLSSNGLMDATPLDNYVVATGSDGYGIVYSMGEIDAAYRAGNIALVAYDDGTGTFPSIGGGGGLFRTTAPFDSKGGRYVSNLETLTVVDALACFARGTRIATPGGAVAVERLREGDTLLTQDGVARPVRWVGQRRIDCRRHRQPQQVWPVRIAAGAFGDGLPLRDLFLSPDHAVLTDGVLIPVRHLVNGTSIAQVRRGSVHYYHVELDRHDIVLAEGLPAESYLETGARASFSNGGGAVTLHPDFSTRVWEAEGCAPIVVTGPALDAARRRIAANAGALTAAGRDTRRDAKPGTRTR
ncbi:MAG: Hint domain-containing protein [Acetobacteraceae bacterium]